MDRRVLILISLAVLFGIVACGSSHRKTSYRLPNAIKPKHYNLEIATDLEDPADFKFSGKVAIEVIASKNVKNIVLHSKDLVIDERNISLKSLNSANRIPIRSVDYDEDFDFLTLGLDESLRKGSAYVLNVPFKGVLKPGLVGYYLSSYQNKNGKNEWLAVTHFEPSNARRAFPCFDEPALKATFSVSLIRSENFTSTSNMPLIETKKISTKPGYELDIFKKSVPMSTYLVAYMVSKFKYLESTKIKANETTFRVWARKEALDQTQYAASIGPKVLSFYEDYFGVKFPLPKQDMVALPDFSLGAMENWGMITYRETALLFKDGVSSINNKYGVASVVAHELAHQWFGNLVTMKWWTDLWLNEGFATYVSTLGVNHLQPNWNIINEESADIYARVFKVDSLDSSHPVSVPIGHPRDINQIFDDISYRKGSSLIRMMNAFLTERVFREGLNRYLNEYKYNNAEQTDLLRTLTEVAHERNKLSRDLNLPTIMDSWTTQIGFPVITINRNYSFGNARVTQKRFKSTNDTIKSNKQTWWVPLTYMKKGDNATAASERIQWIPKITEIEIKNTSTSNVWLLANVGMTGLYRVNYDERNWYMLIDAVNKNGHEGIPEMNRYQLLMDSMDLAWSDQLSYDIPLKLMQYLKYENNFVPWRGAMVGLAQINTILKRSADYSVFKKYLRSLLTPVYNNLTSLKNIDEQPLDLTNHAALINRWSCLVDVPGCNEIVLDKFNALIQSNFSGNSIPKDFRSDYYCIGIKKSGEVEWDKLWEIYQKSNVATERVDLLRSMACSNSVWILTRYLERLLDGKSGLRKQDAQIIFNAVGTSEVGYYVAKKFVFERVTDLRHLENATPQNMGVYASVIAGQVTSDLELNELVEWIKLNWEYFKESTLAIEQALESARIRLGWIKKNQKHVVDILNRMTKA